jgi:hypothetical protein
MYNIERCEEIVNSQTIAEQLPSHRSKKSFSKKIDNSYTSSRESFSDTLLWHGEVDHRDVQLDTPSVVRRPET